MTQVHNFTVSAQDIVSSADCLYLPSVLQEFLQSTNADDETFCTALLTSQVVMVQSLQPKGREFEFTYVLVFLFCIFIFF